MNNRLSLAIADGAVALPKGKVAIFSPPADLQLDFVQNSDVQVISSNAEDHATWRSRGYDVKRSPEGAFGAAIVVVPRAKEKARALLAQAAKLASVVIIDGQKTDGVDSLLRQLKALADVGQVFAKAHGKTALIQSADLSDWATPALIAVDGWAVAPGAFSSDGPDPASVMLGDLLPPLKGNVCDLGAGWGYLSQRVLERGSPAALVLVEVDADALDAARKNVVSDVARFEWTDAKTYTEGGFDNIISNPPFHSGRKGDVGLGQAFIATAARNLKRSGVFRMVANRHLPYEAKLQDCFGVVKEIGGDGRFKVFEARKPK